MTVFSLLAQGASLGFAASVSPGPFLTYVISQTLARGWRQTFSLMFSPLLSDIPISLTTILVLNQLPAEALRVIQAVGGLFVLWLAWGMLRAVRSGKALIEETADPTPARGMLLRGVLASFLSPGAWIFWSTVTGPIVVNAWRESPAAALAFLFGFYAVFVTGLGVWIAISHQARRLDQRIIRFLMSVSVAIMVAFGALLLKAGLFP